MGNAAYGLHVITDRIKDPEAREFFRGWNVIMRPAFIGVTMSIFAVFQVTAVSVRLWMQRRTTRAALPSAQDRSRR
jgi:hypothetical protein